MVVKYVPFLLALVIANPVLNVIIPQTLDHPLLDTALGRHLKSFALVSQNYKNLQQPIILPKNLLLTPQLKIPNTLVQMGEGMTSHHLASLGFESSSIPDPVSLSLLANLKEMEYPKKIMAGAVIKGVAKTSKFPINVAYSTNSLGFLPVEQSGGGLESAFSTIPTEVSAGGFNNAQSIAFGF